MNKSPTVIIEHKDQSNEQDHPKQTQKAKPLGYVESVRITPDRLINAVKKHTRAGGSNEY